MKNFDQLPTPEITEKPKFLYHASSNKEIEIFEPRNESVRDKNEGPVVFATPDKAFASMFIVPVNDSWAKLSKFNGENYIIISDEKRFKNLDHGGAIYSLPCKTFKTDPQKSKNGREWTSKERVRADDKIIFNSGLEAMKENNVKVYFVDEPTFKKIKQAEDHGLTILRTLKPEN